MKPTFANPDVQQGQQENPLVGPQLARATAKAEEPVELHPILDAAPILRGGQRLPQMLRELDRAVVAGQIATISLAHNPFHDELEQGALARAAPVVLQEGLPQRMPMGVPMPRAETQVQAHGALDLDLGEAQLVVAHDDVVPPAMGPILPLLSAQPNLWWAETLTLLSHTSDDGVNSGSGGMGKVVRWG